jgi:hypothetical protein
MRKRSTESIAFGSYTHINLKGFYSGRLSFCDGFHKLLIYTRQHKQVWMT